MAGGRVLLAIKRGTETRISNRNEGNAVLVSAIQPSLDEGREITLDKALLRRSRTRSRSLNVQRGCAAVIGRRLARVCIGVVAQARFSSCKCGAWPKQRHRSYKQGSQ